MDAAFPESTPLAKVTPFGRFPNSVMVGVGTPTAVTVKLPATPLVKVVVLAEVKAGAEFTVRVKDWVASGFTALVASISRS